MNKTSNSSQSLRAGVGRRSITPPVGVDQTGYLGRPGPSTGIHDDLYAAALALDDGATCILILSIDLLSTNLDQDAALRKSISEATGVDPRNALTVCSHTHGGPAVHFLRRCGTPDEDYVKWAFAQAVSAAAEAARALSPARLSYARTESELGINRRSWVIERQVQASPTSGTITDPELSALVVDVEGRGRVVLYNYACHGVVMGGDNVQITADWIGAARSILESDPSVEMAMFAQGCCGNINPRVRGTFEDVERAGEMVARPLLSALPGAKPVDGPSIRVAWKTVGLPFLPLPPLRKLAQQLARLREQIEAKSAAGAERLALEPDRSMLSWAEDALKASRAGGGPKSTQLPLQAISIGSIILAAIPGEAFCEIGLAVKANAGSPVMTIGYANGNVGYIPTAAAFREGGYETDAAHRYYGVKMIGPESEAIVVRAMTGLIKEVRQ